MSRLVVSNEIVFSGVEGRGLETDMILLPHRHFICTPANHLSTVTKEPLNNIRILAAGVDALVFLNTVNMDSTHMDQQ